jgi:hypothetical protein
MISVAIREAAISQLSRVLSRSEELPDLLTDLLSTFNLLNIPVPDVFLTEYCSVRGNRLSELTLQDIASSTNVTSAGGLHRLNAFQYGTIPETSRPRPRLLSFSFNQRTLKTMVATRLPFLDFDLFLPDLTEKLKSLRSIIYSVKSIGGLRKSLVWSENTIQMMMRLFLNYTFDKCQCHMIASSANRGEINAIELTVTAPDASTTVWNGFTDLKCCMESTMDINGAISTLEMKVPFDSSGLYRSAAPRPKQQFIGEAMGLLQGSPNCAYNLSYLTDIFAQSVMYYTGVEAYLSNRVTDANEFCLQLLLMCCGDLSSDDWKGLMLADTVIPIDFIVSNEDDIVSNEDDTVSNPEVASRGPTTRSQTIGGGGHKGNVACGTFGCKQEEAHERRLADFADMQRWEAKCEGFQYLGFEEMQQHNSIMS